MNITKEQADKVIATIEFQNAVIKELLIKIPGHSIHLQGFKNVTDGAEALSIMRGLEDAEPCKHEWFRTGAAYSTGRACIHCGTWCGTSPQADQTEEALRDVVRQSEDMGLYDADFQTGRAGGKP